MSVSPAGTPVEVCCLAERSYKFLARPLSFGWAGSAHATAVNPAATTPQICLMPSMVFCDRILIQVGSTTIAWADAIFGYPQRGVSLGTERIDVCTTRPAWAIRNTGDIKVLMPVKGGERVKSDCVLRVSKPALQWITREGNERVLLQTFGGRAH